MYINYEDEDNDTNDDTNTTNDTNNNPTTTSINNTAKDSDQQCQKLLQKRLEQLEDENSQLKQQTKHITAASEDFEEQENFLVNDCVDQLKVGGWVYVSVVRGKLIYVKLIDLLVGKQGMIVYY